MSQSIINEIKKCKFSANDELLLIRASSSLSYVTTTQFIACHHILNSRTEHIGNVEMIWLYLYGKLYQYQPGVFLLIVKSKFRKLIGTVGLIKLMFLSIIQKKKDSSIIRAFGELLLQKYESLCAGFKRSWLTMSQKGRLSIAKSCKIGKHTFFYIDHFDSKISLSSDVVIRNFCSFRTDDGGVIKLGKNVFLNNYCSLNALAKIDIGANTMLGEGVKIYDHNHSYEFNDMNLLKVSSNTFVKDEVVIGSNCWIGSNTTILKGVSIGDNVIIGANNLIFKSIESNTIVVSKQEKVLKTH